MASTPSIQQSVDSRLPPPFQNSSDVTLITQGAEGLVFRSTFLSPATPCAIKVRPRKAYRHPTLDVRLTKQRILAEARVLVRCAKDGVTVPGVLGADWEAGWIAMEWIYGQTIRACLDSFLRQLEDQGAKFDESRELLDLMKRVGEAVGRLHEIGVIHGDLTTSNLMLRPTVQNTNDKLQGEVVLIDFGLATQSLHEEDRAVDLYVLERAWGSTHPQAEALFNEALKAYGKSYKSGKVVLKKLEEVRLRGRKKSMLG